MAEVPIALKVRNYRCFGNEFAGFDVIRPINVIIGRNNSGKSALLDLVQVACTGGKFDPQDAPAGTTTEMQFSAPLTKGAVETVFRQNTQGGDVVGGRSHWEVGSQYVNALIRWRQVGGANADARVLEDISVAPAIYRNAGAKTNYERQLARQMPNPLQGREFRRIAAERNVVPEPSDSAMDPKPDGSKVTNFVQRCYNLTGPHRPLVEQVLLNELNEVVSPDYRFRGIVPRQRGDGSWELYLDEEGKGQVALSASGSGLKTILCVLVNMSLWPHYRNSDASNWIFAFEELENSLHPALLRRLLGYVARRVGEQGSTVFLTSHSNVAIDMFAGVSNAQVVHTTHKPGRPATVTPITGYREKRGLLVDLDVRASDVLQANGIIWVEGPSDRTYVNHWLSLVSKGELKEGTHYQCVFYGGRLLAHLSAEDPEKDEDGGVAILRVNTNTAVLIDSDKRNADAPVNRTKERIRREIGSIGGYCWVTAGREVENYLPTEAIRAATGLAADVELGQFDDLGDALDRLEEGAGRRFERGKAEFAVQVIDHVVFEHQQRVLDWYERINELARIVREWNRLPAVELHEA